MENGTQNVTFTLVDDVTVISMDEEMDVPIVIAIVDGYNGDQKPEIGSFDFGNNFDLGLDFKLNQNEWKMVVSKKQDYEQPVMRKYVYNVRIGGKSSMVQITINNIFDNSPVITPGLNSNPCSISVMINLHHCICMSISKHCLSGTGRF